MIETILQFEDQAYPFDTQDDTPNMKLETLIECENKDHLESLKKKFQIIKNCCSFGLVKLQGIFQESLRIHLVYEYIPVSLASCLVKCIEDEDDENILMKKKQILQMISIELGELTEHLSTIKILTKLKYENFGALREKDTFMIKYYVGSSFQVSSEQKEKIAEFYLSERKRILSEAERDLQLERRSDYLPNFIMRGNKLLFTDDLSETKTTKKRDQSPHYFDPFETSEKDGPKKKKNNFEKEKTKLPKQKRHKYSFEQGPSFDFDFDRERRNEEDERSDTYSVTQTKSIKFEVEHQKPTQKCRKNSYKLKITTFEEISIDNEGEAGFDLYNFANREFEPQNNQPSPDWNPTDSQSHDNPEKVKDYKEKVKDAKLKAELLIKKYMKSKSKNQK